MGAQEMESPKRAGLVQFGEHTVTAAPSTIAFPLALRRTLVREVTTFPPSVSSMVDL